MDEHEKKYCDFKNRIITLITAIKWVDSGEVRDASESSLDISINFALKIFFNESTVRKTCAAELNSFSQLSESPTLVVFLFHQCSCLHFGTADQCRVRVTMDASTMGFSDSSLSRGNLHFGRFSYTLFPKGTT